MPVKPKKKKIYTEVYEMKTTGFQNEEPKPKPKKKRSKRASKTAY